LVNNFLLNTLLKKMVAKIYQSNVKH